MFTPDNFGSRDEDFESQKESDLAFYRKWARDLTEYEEAPTKEVFDRMADILKKGYSELAEIDKELKPFMSFKDILEVEGNPEHDRNAVFFKKSMTIDRMIDDADSLGLSLSPEDKEELKSLQKILSGVSFFGKEMTDDEEKLVKQVMEKFSKEIRNAELKLESIQDLENLRDQVDGSEAN